MAVAGELESRADVSQIGGEQAYWQVQLDLSDRDHGDWIKNGKETIDRYKAESKITSSRMDRKKFNILYSNTEVLKAALFARMAKPDVRRRFSDPDPVGRQVAEIIERTLIAVNDTANVERELFAAIEDYTLPGRGVVRIRYEAQLATHPQTGLEYVAQQDVWDEHILWRHFRHEPAETWAQVTWVGFMSLMTKDDLHQNFDAALGADQVDKIPLNYQPDTWEKKRLEDAFRKAEVWEVWDKVMRQRLFIVKGYDKVLRKDPDPYGLEDFFPMPEPLQVVTTNDSFIPQPEFMIYKDQADGLDEIEARIDRLTKALKRRGVYNAVIDELKRVGKAADNEFIPVRKWDELQAGGGLKKVYEVEDITPLVAVLQELAQQRELRKETIYEIIGISDIMRGVSNPNDTATAQNIKAQFGTNRLKKRQDRVQTFIKDLLRLKAEIIAEHYEPQKFAEMTGFPYMPQPQMDPTTGQPAPMPDNAITQQVMDVIRQDRLRSYRIDIETDSTIYQDAQEEKQSRVELITAMSQFVTTWMPLVQAQPQMLPLGMAMLAFGVRGFKAGRELEEQIEQTQMQLEQAAQQQQPDPTQMQAQQDAQLQQMKQQHEAQMQQAQQGHEAQMEQMKQGHDQQAAQIQAATDNHQAQLKAMTDQHEAQISAMQDHHKTAQDALAKAHANDLQAKKLEQEDRHHKDKISLERNKHTLATAVHNKTMLDETNEDLAPPTSMTAMSPMDAIMQALNGIADGQVTAVKLVAEEQIKAQEEMTKAITAVTKDNTEAIRSLTKVAAAPKRVSRRDREGRIEEMETVTPTVQ